MSVPQKPFELEDQTYRKDADSLPPKFWKQEELPSLVDTILRLGALLVGSQATRMVIGRSPDRSRDWDILVPHRMWHAVAAVVAELAADPEVSAVPTGFGGWRLCVKATPESTPVFVDVWPDDWIRYGIHGAHGLKKTMHGVDFLRGVIFKAEAPALSLSASLAKEMSRD